MEVKIVNIGNSKGIRLSKTILEKYSIQDKVEVILKDNYFIIKPKSEPRKDWDEVFKLLHNNGDDQLIIDDVFEDEDFEA